MEFPTWLAAAIIGVIEGITEFLPISSTAHIRLTEHALGFKDPGEVFAVTIQLGAILAVVVLFWARLVALGRGVLSRDPASLRFAAAIVVACLPAGVLGLVLNRWLEDHVFSGYELVIIALTSGVGGLAILLIERFRPQPQHRDPAQIPWLTALGIGFIQVMAMIPGVSRSGASIMGGMCLRVERQAATEFSFFLAIPLMLGASGLKLVKHRDALAHNSELLVATVIGFVVSFVVALLVVRWLLRYVSGHTFAPFAWYRIALGLVIAGLLVTGLISAGGK